MSWFSTSGLASLLGNLFKTTVNNKDFQQSAVDFITQTMQRLLLHKNNPQAVATIAQGLIDHADAAVGAMVTNTEAEGLVDPALVQKAQQAGAPAAQK
jgi:hypothetical protein